MVKMNSVARTKEVFFVTKTLAVVVLVDVIIVV